MGYIDFYKRVQCQLDDALPFVIFRKPNEGSVKGFLQQTNDLRISNDFDKSGFVFSPFSEGKDKTVWMYRDECDLIESNFRKHTDDRFLVIYEESISKKEKHISIVDKAIESIKSGDLQKVVISRSEMLEIRNKEPLEWFERIVSLYPNAFCYCWYHPEVGMWLGASPETLISLTKTSFETMALAGTMPFLQEAQAIWGDKEKEEQQLVVDSILKALKPVTKQVRKGETKTQKAGKLLHLKTDIAGELNTLSDVKVLVDILHPTSAVCGLPKEKSKEFILKNEEHDRSYYTGYLGSFSKEENTHLFVNLRCMQVHDTSVQIYVGGGITALSDTEAEWVETVNKSQIMKVIL